METTTEPKIAEVYESRSELAKKLTETVEMICDTRDHMGTLITRFDLLDTSAIDATMDSLRECVQKLYCKVARCPLYNGGNLQFASTAMNFAQKIVHDLRAIHDDVMCFKLDLLQKQARLGRRDNVELSKTGVSRDDRRILAVTIATITIQLTTLESSLMSTILLGESGVNWHTHLSMVHATFSEGSDSTSDDDCDNGPDEDSLSDIPEADPETVYHELGGKWLDEDPDDYYDHYGPEAPGYDEWLKKKDPHKYALRMAMLESGEDKPPASEEVLDKGDGV